MNGSMIVQNPVSLIGSAKRIIPWGSRGHGWWQKTLIWAGTVLALILAWAAVLAVYAVLTGFAVLWIPWAFWTLGRRHHVHDRRRIAAIHQDALTR